MIKKTLNLDQLIANVLLFMAVFIAILLFLGDQSLPIVKSVELPKFELSGASPDLVVEFNDLMDRNSVEKAWTISPQVNGNFSWYGKKLVFVPESGFSLSSKYTFKIAKTAKSEEGKFLANDFIYNFETPIERIVFSKNVGVGSEIYQYSEMTNVREKLFSFGQPIKNLQLDQNKKRLYFFTDADFPQLYFYDFISKKIVEVTTGQEFLNKDYQLSDDGRNMTLSKIKVSDEGEYQSKVLLWLSDTTDFRFKEFGNGAQGLDAAFSPRAAYLLYRNADSNFELKKIDENLLDGQREDTLFIGEFSKGFGFHPYLPEMVFTEYDQEDVFSLNNKLVLFSGDGEKKYLNMPNGVFREASFSPDGKWLYFLFSGDSDNLTSQDDLVEARAFHLYRANVKDLRVEQLTSDNDYSEQSFSLSKDSKQVLLKRVFANKENLIDPGFIELSGKKIAYDWWTLELDNQLGQIRKLDIDADEAFYTF